jgi:hypothetical protein
LSVRYARVEAPRTRTVEKKSSALRSAGVGIPHASRRARSYVIEGARPAA